MKVFISWSGEQSRQVAEILHNWIPKALQSVEPFLSVHDIHPGARSLHKIAEELEVAQFGIVCVTARNQEAPWLNFEAGALSKSVVEGRVSAFLTDLKSADVQPPLGQFQHVQADQVSVEKLLNSINSASDGPRMEASRLAISVDKWWPELHSDLNKVTPDDATPTQTRSVENMVEELLGLVRAIPRELRASSPEGGHQDQEGQVPRDQTLQRQSEFWKNMPRNGNQYEVDAYMEQWQRSNASAHDPGLPPKTSDDDDTSS